jgi:malonyl-CoA/methylmalonyl-CoA synthetase
MSNLYQLLESSFPKNPNACAFETVDSRYYTFDDLRFGSAKIANWLTSLGVARGSRIAVQVEKSVEAVMLYLATLRAGFTFLPLNTAYREAEISYFLNDAQPAVVICSPENLQ